MLGLTLLTVVATVPIYLSQRTPYAKNGSDWAEVSSTIGSHAHAGDAIVFDDGARPSRRPRLALHTYPAGFAGLKDVTLKTPYQHSSTWYDRTYTVPAAEKLGRFNTVSRVWLVEYVTSGKSDTYGLSDIKSMGFTVTATYKTHSSLILELVRS
jgi:mannosyltransferase